MHRLKSNWGSTLPGLAIALAAAAVVALVVVINLSGDGTAQVNATSVTPPLSTSQKFTGVSCADIYIDLGTTTPLGSPPDVDDALSAAAITRTEPSATDATRLQVTTVSYLGPDLVAGDEAAAINDAIPDTGPTINLCDVSRTNSQSAAESEDMHIRTAFANQFSVRPTSQAIYGIYDPANAEDGGAANTCNDGIEQAGDDTDTRDFTDEDCFDPGNRINFSTCAFSESLSLWQRTDSTNVISDKTASATNYGRVTLYVATGAPTGGVLAADPNVAVDAASCSTAGALAFPSVSVIRAREASTDDPGFAPNAAAISASQLTTDPNGAGVLDSSDGLSDDWDGDGCPDWDELDDRFTYDFAATASTDQHGMDPFNPNDCDEDYNSNIGLTVTVIPNTSVCTLTQAVTQTCEPGGAPGSPNGQYFHCRSTVTHTLSGSPQPVGWISGCYSDSTVQVVNGAYFAESGASCTNAVDNDGDGFINDGCPAVGPPETGAQCTNATDNDGDSVVNDGCPSEPDTCPPAAQANCGDGKKGPRPPGGSTTNSPQAFIAVDEDTFPVPFSGSYNTSTDQLAFDICLIGFGGSFFGPNVHAIGIIDGRTGAGQMDLEGGLTAGDCSGTPTLTLPDNEVEMVELRNTRGLPISQHFDSDHDGCTDSEELQTGSGSEITGGKRDPYNKWDYFNPLVAGTKAQSNTNRVPDISKVVANFGIDAPAAGYKQQNDRGGTVPGSNLWNFLPPNGTVRAADITAAVQSFGHDCTGENPPPYTHK